MVPGNIFNNKHEFTQSWETAFDWSVQTTKGSGSSFHVCGAGTRDETLRERWRGMEARVELHGGLLRGTVWTHIFLGENVLHTFLGYTHTYILYYLSFTQAFSRLGFNISKSMLFLKVLITL